MDNPLRRRSDRIESGMTLTLILLFAVAGPLLGWWAARSSYLADDRATTWERDHLRQVEAVLVAEPETVGMAESRTVAPRGANATWRAPDGTSRTGIVQVAPEARRGDKMVIWTDHRGTLHAPPQERDPLAQATLVAAAVLLCMAAALAGLRAAGRAVLDRRRALAWQREWLEVGPRWNQDQR